VSDAVIREPGQAERLALGASTIGFLITGEDTGGALALSEGTPAPGFPGPVRHRHARMHDVVVVPEGVVRFRVGDEERDLGAARYDVEALPGGTPDDGGRP